MQTDADDEWHSLDSTIHRAHQHAAGGERGAAAQGMGRSRGGLSTKVHLVIDPLGLPLTFEITEGQRHDSRPAQERVARVWSRCLLADKAYDSDAFRNALEQQACVPVIPPLVGCSPGHSSKLIANLMSIDITRTTCCLPV
jgi:hypothetical protein